MIGTGDVLLHRPPNFLKLLTKTSGPAYDLFIFIMFSIIRNHSCFGKAVWIRGPFNVRIAGYCYQLSTSDM